MSGLNLKEVLITYSHSPNNTNSKLKQALQDKGFNISKGNKGRILLANEKFTLSITPADKDYADVRQFDGSTAGLVTLWLRTGSLYIIRTRDLELTSVTRENNAVVFIQAVSKLPLTNNLLLHNRTTKNITDYLLEIEYAQNHMPNKLAKLKEQIIHYNNL